MPKVSIILTSFNHEKYIREAIESVLHQTFADYELFIWDDASRDRSWEIICSYNDPRIKPYCNEEQKRGIYGINKVISELARGEYIAIHHSDDVWEPAKLEKQVAFLDQHQEYGAVFTNAQAINENGFPLEDSSYFYNTIFEQPNRTRHEWLNHFFYHGNALCHPSVLIRKQCYDDCGLYRYGFAQLGDFDMWVRLCLKHDIYILPEKLVRFRVLDNEMNTSGDRPDSRVRVQTEFFIILDNFTQINNFSELSLVFPEAEKYFCNGKGDVVFALFMMGLNEISWNVTKLYSIKNMFGLINQEEKRNQLVDVHNFSYHDLIQLSGRHDIFNINTLHKIANKESESFLFFDTGNGFNIGQSKKAVVTPNTKLIEHDLGGCANIKALRLDPAETALVCRLTESIIIDTSGRSLDIEQIENNAIETNGGFLYFSTRDPIIIFSVPKDTIINKVRFQIEYSAFGEDALRHIFETTRGELETTRGELETVYNSDLYRVVVKLKKLTHVLRIIYPLRWFLRCYRWFVKK